MKPTKNSETYLKVTIDTNSLFINQCRKTPSFNYGDIRHINDITVGSAPLSAIKAYIENQKNV